MFRLHFSPALISQKFRIIWLGSVTILVAACGEAPPQAGGGMFGGPMPVAAITVQPESIPVALEYTAQTQGSREVEVRARVTGILVSRNYKEGDVVKAKQSLFTIDQAPFDAALDRAQADLVAAQARLAQAEREVQRLKPLVEAKAVSRQEFDTASSSQAIYDADVLAAKARVKEAKLNLQWTRVETPIAGIASRALKSEGSLISGPDVLLTTVSQVDPIHVLFGIPDSEQNKLRQEMQTGAWKMPADGKFRVAVILPDGTEYGEKGVLDFRDARVNSSTGTSEARAEIPNPNAILRPGQFVRVRLVGAERAAAFKVPQRAVLNGPQGRFVYVIDKESKAEARPVDVGDWSGDTWVVTRGLNAGDAVIVDGVLKLGPGAPVMIGDAPAAPPAAPAAPPAAASG